MGRSNVRKFGVYTRVPAPQARGKKVRSRWVENYTYVSGEKTVRPRLVAQEFATDVRYDAFAGTPPLKAVRLGLCVASTFPSRR